MGENKSVLIVENDALQAYVLKLLLSNLNYDVLAISNSGEEAVELASELKPQFIIMDISLDGQIDGIEAVGRIHLEASSAKIIFLTGISDSATIRKAKSVGFDDFLMKLIDKKMLVESLTKVLS